MRRGSNLANNSPVSGATKIPPQTVTVYAEVFVLLYIYFLFRLQSVNFSKVFFGEFEYHR